MDKPRTNKANSTADPPEKWKQLSGNEREDEMADGGGVAHEA